MSLKILLGILAFLFIVNIVAIDTYLYYHVNNDQSAITEMTKTTSYNDQPKEGSDPLSALDETQKNKLRESIEGFRKSTGELNGRIKILDDDIFRFVQNSTFSQDSLDRKLKEIASIRYEISKIAITKILESKSFLSKNQQEQMFSALFRIKQNFSQRKPDSTGTKEHGRENNEQKRNESGNVLPPKSNRLKKYTEQLHLTDDQVKKLDVILETSQKKYSALDAKNIDDPSEYKKAKKTIMDEEDVNIMNVLTAEQKKVFTTMKNKPRKEPKQKEQNEPPPRD